MSESPTSPYTPDIVELRSWLEQMVARMKLVELVLAVIGLVTRMRDINLELTKRVAHLTRKRPLSESLERVERQLVLPFAELQAAKAPKKERQPNESKPKREHTGGGRNEFPAYLERVPVDNPVPDEQRLCPICRTEMTSIGHSMCEKLTLIPARLVVEQRLDERLVCPNDDTIVAAVAPAAIVDGGKLADTFIVESTCDKYIEHQPLERQCGRWARAGVEVAPQTLGRAVAEHLDLLAPLARLINEETRGPGLLGTDATGLPVLDPAEASGIKTGTMWCWTNGPWVSFFYSARGDSDSIRRFLGKDWCRVVQCDGTNLTTFIERAGGKRPGCWAHGRRRLVETARSGDTLALETLRLIAPLFAIEKTSKLASDTREQRLARRLEHSRPVVDRIRSWIDEQRQLVPPKTPFGRALGYLHRQWRRLVLFLEDGNIELTNNRRERELRRLVLGRKNWLFAWLDEGGKRTATILTIVASCIAHDVNPRGYLHLVTRLIVQGWPNGKLRELLPDRLLAAHPELYVGDRSALPTSVMSPALTG